MPKKRPALGPVIGAHLMVAAPILAIFIGHLYAGAFAVEQSSVLGAVMLAVAAIGAAAWKDSAIVLGARSLWIAAALFAVPLAVALIQTFVPGFDHEYALLAFLRLFGMGAVFVLGAVIGFDEGRLARFKGWMCLAVLLFAAFSLVHFHLVQTHALPLPLFMQEGRLFSTFFSANSAALELAIGLMVTAAVFVAEFRGGESDFEGRQHIRAIGWLAAAAATISLVAVGLTRSRTGIVLAVAVPAIGILIVSKKTRRNLLVWALPIAVFALAAVVVTLFTRFGDGGDNFGLRFHIYEAHLPSVLDRPLLGHGFGSFSALSRKAINEANFDAIHNVGAMHNLYLQWPEQAGLVASLAMGACVIWVMAKLFSQMSMGRRASVYWVRGALAALLIAFGQGLLDFGVEHYSILLMLTIIAGTAFGLCQRRDVRMASPGRSVRRSRAPSDVEEAA